MEDAEGPPTPTPTAKGRKLYRTPPTTVDINRTTVTTARRKGKGRQRVLREEETSEEDSAHEDTAQEETAGPSSAPTEEGEPAGPAAEEQEEEAEEEAAVPARRGNPSRRRARQQDEKEDDGVYIPQQEARLTRKEEEEDILLPSEFMDGVKEFGSKISEKLTGPDDYPAWREGIEMKAKDLGAAATLTGQQGPIGAKLWRMMNVAIKTTIVDSVGGPLKREIKALEPAEALKLLKERYSRSDAASYCTVGLKFISYSQNQQTIQEYIARFDTLRSEFEAAGGEMNKSVELTLFMKGLRQEVSKEAYGELNRQKGEPDMEMLRQALVRHAAFEKSQREIMKSKEGVDSGRGGHRNASAERARGSGRVTGFGGRGGQQGPDYPRQEEIRRGGIRIGKWTGPGSYTGVICDRCDGQHRTELCPGAGKKAYSAENKKEVVQKAHLIRFACDSQGIRRGEAYSSWLLDSAASVHMSKERPDDLRPMQRPERMQAATGETMEAAGIGQLRIGPIQLNNVRFVPSVDMNLMSIGVFDDEGWRIEIENGWAVLSKGRTSVKIKKAGGVYPVTEEVLQAVKEETMKEGRWVKESLLHKRMGHLNQDQLRMLTEVTDVVVKKEKKDFCEACVVAKQHKKPNREPSTRSARPGQRIHVDLCGGGYTFALKEAQNEEEFAELPVSEGGAKSFIVMTDDYSRFRKTVPLKKKNEAEQAIKEFVMEIEAKGYRTEAIRKDGGKEFGSKRFEKWPRDKGIQIENSAPYTPEQNGLSERSVGMVCEKARSMLLATDLPSSLWAEAVLTATYLMNRSPTRLLRSGLTPYEAFYGSRPSIQHLRVFNCVAYAKISARKTQGKLAPRSTRMRLLGYESTNIYRVWNSETRGVTLSRDVVFDEAALGKREAVASGTLNEAPVRSVENETLSDIAREALNLVDFEEMENEAPIMASVRRVDPVAVCLRSYAQAKHSVGAEEWQTAMEKEMKALTDNETWAVMDIGALPAGMKVLSGKWVYNEKEQENGEKI